MPYVTPFIPELITVHLGSPDSDAANVTVSFADYIKNVASSELYPTWDEQALRANILAITSFALNRIYTEFYRSRGNEFDITNTTANDQAFVNGRNYFENISQLVYELFDDYIHRQGFVEPLAAAFCNGTTSTCAGLSQWGSENLAQQGYDYLQILRAYYGDDVEIVQNAPIQSNQPSYPGTPLREGDAGPSVTFIQEALNRVSQNYPAIPKINPVNGVFDATTGDAVRALQEIFNLPISSIVEKSTWYQLVRLYVAVQRLAELNSEGQTYDEISWAYPDAIVEGDTGIKVSHLQYMLSVLAEFYREIPPLKVTGSFDEATKNAALAFQLLSEAPQTGQVGAATWDAIYDAYAGIASTVTNRGELFPYQNSPFPPAANMRELQRQLDSLAAVTPGLICPAPTGRPDAATCQALRQLQRLCGLPINGQANEETKNALANRLGNLRLQNTCRFAQYPGRVLSMGMTDFEKEAPDEQ